MADRVETTIILISFDQTSELDDFLQPVDGNENRTEVCATSVPVSRAEFYAAGEKGFRPDFLFEVNPVEYSGQPIAEVCDLETGINQRCRIYRTYRPDPDTLELYCSRAAGLDEAEEDQDVPEVVDDAVAEDS